MTETAGSRFIPSGLDIAARFFGHPLAGSIHYEPGRRPVARKKAGPYTKCASASCLFRRLGVKLTLKSAILKLLAGPCGNQQISFRSFTWKL